MISQIGTDRTVEIGIVFLAVVVTQFAISWVGRYTYNIGCDKLQYAYFVFAEERQTPLTTNILMNVFIPCVVMAIIYDIYSYLHMGMTQYVWMFTPLFFFWRLILICVVLRRPEFYNTKYEICTAFVGTVLSYGLYKGILSRTEPFFLRTEDLREELGFAIIVAVYGFAKMAVDNKVKQSDIVTTIDIEKYVKKNDMYPLYWTNQ